MRSVSSSTVALQAMLHDVEERQDQPIEPGGPEFSFFEVTIASVDQPKLLCRLSAALVGAVRHHNGHSRAAQLCSDLPLLVPVSTDSLRYGCRGT